VERSADDARSLESEINRLQCDYGDPLGLWRQYDEPSLKPMEDDSPTGQTNRSSFSHGLGFGFDLLHFLAGFITTVAILAAIKLSKSISVFGARPWDSLLDGSEQSVASVSQRFRCGFQV
jgi:hypothetical protein